MIAKVINKSDIKKAIGLKGPIGSIIAGLAMWLFGLNKVNRLFNKCKDVHDGPAFCEKLLKELKIKVNIDQEQLDHIPQDRPFITISNHPIGSIDGIALMMVVGGLRSDYKIMVNHILAMIPNLKDRFIPVNVFGGDSNMPNVEMSNISGMRAALQLIQDGGALGLFPAGEVSTFQKGDNKVAPSTTRVCEDIQWPENMTKLVAKAGVTVVPIYFDGRNSKLFHWLGRIHPFFRTLRLPMEAFNKKGKELKMIIGKPITYSEIKEFSDRADLGGYLRNYVYALEANLPVKIREEQIPEVVHPIALPRNKKAILKEIKELGNNGKKLYDSGSFSCYLADYEQIPNLIHEVGRRREEAFRATGEGTNKPIDLDQYDPYYKHLLLWDNNRKKLAGAYRFGIGVDALDHGGINGLYTSTLFKFDDKFKEMMPQFIELGRSFVSVEYQKESLPLMLLIKGITISMLQFPNVRYLMGPVSISNAYPDFYKSLMAWYIESKYSSIPEVKDLVEPRTPFQYDFLRVDPEKLVGRRVASIERFDRFLLKISDGKYRLPTLVKKYLKINCNFICFNIDPDFNYCLDGLMVLDIQRLPEVELMMLTRDMDVMSREKVYNRFGKSFINKEK